MKNALFVCAISDGKTAIICQDRLGTNTFGSLKTEWRVFFSLIAGHDDDGHVTDAGGVLCHPLRDVRDPAGDGIHDAGASDAGQEGRAVIEEDQ